MSIGGGGGQASSWRRPALVTMSLLLLCHWTSVPMGGVISKFDCMPYCLNYKSAPHLQQPI